MEHLQWRHMVITVPCTAGKILFHYCAQENVKLCCATDPDCIQGWPWYFPLGCRVPIDMREQCYGHTSTQAPQRQGHNDICMYNTTTIDIKTYYESLLSAIWILADLPIPCNILITNTNHTSSIRTTSIFYSVQHHRNELCKNFAERFPAAYTHHFNTTVQMRR